MNPIIDDFGTQRWIENGQQHRDDGPAVIRASGTKYWYQNGRLHRNGGPAAVYDRGRYWYQNGKLHCEDGPAIITSDGRKAWFVHGVKCDTQAKYEWALAGLTGIIK